jgi:hypothetical protein
VWLTGVCYAKANQKDLGFAQAPTRPN